MTTTAITLARTPVRTANGGSGPVSGRLIARARLSRLRGRRPGRPGSRASARGLVGQDDLAGLEDVAAVGEASAISAFCSTSRTVVPCSLIS